VETGDSLDLTRAFLPEALAGLADVHALGDDDRRPLNQIRAISYLHIFDQLETCLSEAARAQAVHDEDVRDTLAPLLHLDSFDHNEMFRTFGRTFESHFPVASKLVPRPADLDEILGDAAPLSLLILALQLKLVTQQHYLACTHEGECLEPSFVRLLKDHWSVECGRARDHASSPRSIQRALSTALPGRVPAALRDYRRILSVCDDVLRRQSALDVETLEALRGSPVSALSGSREAVVTAQLAALRKTFITFGIVNAAFVYAMRTLGPEASSMLEGVVSAFSVEGSPSSSPRAF
jgi:hypothetical protein